MYDELVKNLRGRSQFLLPHYGEEISYDSDLMKQTADAIEELCGLCASQSKDCSEAVAKYLELWVKQPRWIPVTERLPEERCDYLVFAVGGAWRQISSIEIAYWDGDRFLVQSFNAVTHWMPLPEPPKDGES